MRIIAILLCLFPHFALAENIAQVDGDFTGDGRLDRAILTETTIGKNADLLLFIRQTDGGLILQTKAGKLAWVGGMGGQKPELEISPRGSLLIHTMNESIGRDRWRQTLTVAWRNDRFVLAGVTFSWRDTLDPERTGFCDVNLLSGKGERTRGTFLRPIEFTTSYKSVPIKVWAETRAKLGPAEWMKSIPTECRLWQ